ncbi:fungal-specific transcription factor domain-containing protein [Fennellomyces sp. T-0311]|nr:fungal-specific transcription factor domain-containing protein [Fennellomyces sp. T-0311]
MRPRITQSVTILSDIPGLTEELIDILIHAYFAFIHPNLPIINKLSFLQQYYYQNPGPPNEYLLSAMCAIGMDFLNFQDGLVVGTDISRDTVWSMKRCLGDKAAKVLQVAYRRSQISTVQTLILLTLFLTLSYEGDDEEDSIHWITAGIAVNMAQDLGLHRSSTGWNIPECEIELRRRIWYAIYIIDVWMAAELGRPTAISDSAFDVEFPSVYEIDSIYHTISDNEDISMCHPLLISQAEWSLRKKSPDYGFFLHLALLSQILRRVLCLLYPQKPTNATQSNVEIIEGLDAALRAWKSNLPAHLQINNIIHDAIAVGDRALLHVFYSCVTVVLHRPLIEDTDLFGTVSWIQSRSVCTTAALDIMYTMDTLASSMSNYIPRSVVGYCVFQAARVFAFNASNANEYDRDLGRLNVAHCAETYIVDEAYIRNSRIVYQLMNLLEKLHWHKDVTQLSDDITKSNEPTDTANQQQTKMLTSHTYTRTPEQSLYGNSLSCGPIDPHIKEAQHIHHLSNTPSVDLWEQLFGLNGSQHITLMEQLLNTNSFSYMDSMRQSKLPLSLDQHNHNSKIPASIATQTSNFGKTTVDKGMKNQPERQQNMKSTEELEFFMALWGLYDTF